MSERYELTTMLREIAEDEKISGSRRKKLSQGEIRKIVLERKEKISGTMMETGDDAPGVEDPAEQGPECPSIGEILEYFASTNGSDLLLATDAAPFVKVHGSLYRSSLPPLTREQCATYAVDLMTDAQWDRFLKEKEIDFAIALDGVGRFRVSAFKDKDTISFAIRLSAGAIPSFEVLGLPRFLEDYAMKSHGLLLFVSPAGQGKTTSFHAMLNVINMKRSCNIMTLENPVEYVHKPLRSNIVQREIDTDTDSFRHSLRRISRYAPDVVAIDGLHGCEDFRIALSTASTGHLVLATMNASDTTSALDGIISRFPIHERSHARRQLAAALLLVVSQRLVPGKDRTSRVPACETLIGSDRVEEFIRHNKWQQIKTQVRSHLKSAALSPSPVSRTG